MTAKQTNGEPTTPTDNKQLPTPPPELADDGSESPQKLTDSSATKDMSTDASSGSSSGDSDNSITSASKPDEAVNSTDAETTKVEDAVLAKSEIVKDSKDADKTNDDKASQTEDKKEEKKDDSSKTDAKKDDEDKKKDEKKKALPRGMKSGVKQLWAKTDAQCKCCTTWVEENPDDGKNVEESDDTLQHAIVVRKKRKHEGNRKPLKVDSIVVHSPLIKKVLQHVFNGYPDLVIDLDELIFDAPFAPFFHRWTQFETAYKSQEDEMTKSHLKLLYDALDLELTKPIQRHNDLVRHKAIDFELLWTLFAPGTLMYSHDNGHDRLYETCDCEYWQDLSGMKFTVRCDMIDWDGEKFGKVMLSENIGKFKGTRQITTLPSYPLKFHAKAEEMKQKCIDRGRRFQELAGVHCKDYKGTAVEYTKYSVQTITSKRQLEGRIMLDEELFSKFNPDEATSLRELDDDDEDVKKAEAEATARLAEQAEKAKEALKKAQEEEKKKQEEEEAKKVKKDEAAEKGKDKEDEKPKSEDKEAQEAPKPDEDKKVEKASDGTPALETPKDDSAAKGTTQKAGDKETTGASAKPDDGATHDPEKVNTDATSTTASTDSSEGIPTPAESEDSTDEPKAFSNNEKQELKEHQLAICTSWLRGYSLNYQKWCSFAVSGIANVVWNDSAFESLTLPPEYRELILATIQSQIRQNQWKQKMEQVEKEQKPMTSLYTKDKEADPESEDDNQVEFDDFIAQKGRGYIMLFSGNPGVGKTATAESIAELLHVPLCIISVGNLGTSAESVESALQDILELASKWNAVLLLDEADIFLEQRTKHDLHRNAVVSVFLRLLEYYQGVLCLTTNRSEEIDVAFHSRIHISLPFPDLTEGNREQIWRHFARITNKKHETGLSKKKKKAVTEIKPTEQTDSTSVETTNGSKTTEVPEPMPDTHHADHLIDLSNTDFRKLSQTQLNGRQIKNAFKTAVLLASYKKEKVQMKHVKTALKTIDGNGLGKREVGGMYY